MVTLVIPDYVGHVWLRFSVLSGVLACRTGRGQGDFGKKTGKIVFLAENGGFVGKMSEFGGVNPGFGGVQPGFGGAKPGIGGAQLRIGGVLPGFGGAQPGFGGVHGYARR
jgi:hypothetical protein